MDGHNLIDRIDADAEAMDRLIRAEAAVRTQQILDRIDANFRKHEPEPRRFWFDDIDTVVLAFGLITLTGTLARAAQLWGWF